MIGYLVALFALVLSYVLGFVLGRRSFVPALPSAPDVWEGSEPTLAPVGPTYISPTLYDRTELVDEFRVVAGDTKYYTGTSGADARRVVERLRGSNTPGEFFQNDVRRDWWPR